MPQWQPANPLDETVDVKRKVTEVPPRHEMAIVAGSSPKLSHEISDLLRSSSVLEAASV